MDYQNAIGIPYGTNDKSKDDILIVRDTLEFQDGVTSLSYAPGISGQGSSRWKYDWQTLYVDCARIAVHVEIECYGSLHRFMAPARTQGFYLLACPEGSFGLVIRRASGVGALSVPIGLFSGEIGPSVWSVPAL